MAYDEALAWRIRKRLGDAHDVAEKKMFGGLAFLVDGNMAFGINGDQLMVRVGPEAYDDSLERPHVREMDFTGRAMRGMVYVAAEGFDSDDTLGEWVDAGLGFARSLPPK